MNELIWIFKEIIYLVATASVLIPLIMLTKAIFNKALNPKWQYYIWILLIFRLLIPIYPESSVSIYNVFYTVAEKANLNISQINVPLQVRTLNQNAENIDRGNNASTETTNIDVDTDKALLDKEIQKNNPAIIILASAWIAGVLILSLYTLYINIAFAINVHKRYFPLKDERISSILEACKKTMNIKRKISLLTSKKVRTPSLYLNSKILVCEAHIKSLSNDEIKYIFLHELSHYKRRDLAVNWLLTLLQIVYFFNPLVWYAFYKIHDDCEIACDAAALRYINKEEYKDYGSTIIKLLRLFSESNLIPVTAGIYKNKSNYKKRIIKISEFQKSKWTSTLLAVILISIVGLTGLTGCSLSKNLGSNSNTATLPNTASSTENEYTAVSTVSPASTTGPTGSSTNSSSTPGTSGATGSATASPAPAPASSGETFYGQWVINQVLAFGSAGTYSSEDAKSLLGKSISFSKDKASGFGDRPSDLTKVITNPVFNESVISKSDFLTNYRMSFEKLGITTDSIPQVTVSDSSGNGYTFLIKGDNTLIIIGGGTYFELLRKAT